MTNRLSITMSDYFDKHKSLHLNLWRYPKEAAKQTRVLPLDAYRVEVTHDVQYIFPFDIGGIRTSPTVVMLLWFSKQKFKNDYFHQSFLVSDTIQNEKGYRLKIGQ